MTTTPGVPVTGENNPSRVSNLIGSPVCGIGGDQLGTVQDLVLDFDQTMVTYVIVDANGSTVAVPWKSISMPAAGGGTGTGTGTGTMATDTPSAGTGLATDTPSAGTGLATDTPSAGGSLSTSTPESGGTGTGTGTGTASSSCLSLTVDNNTFSNAPAFDKSTLPGAGQPANGWDASISSYWANPGSGGTGGTGMATDTPSAGTGLVTDTPSAGTGAMSTDTPAAGTDMTATPGSSTGTGTGAGTGTGMGAQKMQGVMLATEVLGASVTVSPQGNNGTGGTGGSGTLATDTPSAGTGLATDTPSAGGTLSTSTPEAGGTGTGTGTGTSNFNQGTVEDLIVEPATGMMQYLVVRFGSQDNWIPVPIGFLRWDSATNSIVLMVSANALQNAPAFSADQFPDTSMSGWDQQWSGYWQNNGGTGNGTGTGTGGTTISTATATP
jgi:sporulation protein YlmC with PRC-barrel domain